MTTRNARVVLVHGAFSDGSYWRRVVRRLWFAGVDSSVAEVDVEGFAADVTGLRRHLDDFPDSDFILVGHSYGGGVISEVAAGDARVVGLVFVAAAVPLAGVPFSEWMTANPSAYQATPVVDSSGRLRLPLLDCINGLAHDLPEQDAYLLWALQKPVGANTFGDSVSREGWREKPCWYLVAEQDRLIPPAGQRQLAKQAEAVTRTVASGHMVALSNPDAVVDLIKEAMHALVPSPLATSGR